ncbi:hypothetical protein D3C80_2086240 [compost metagenome]
MPCAVAALTALLAFSNSASKPFSLSTSSAISLSASSRMSCTDFEALLSESARSPASETAVAAIVLLPGVAAKV